MHFRLRSLRGFRTYIGKRKLLLFATPKVPTFVHHRAAQKNHLFFNNFGHVLSYCRSRMNSF
jgi:hypothetical protein